MDVLSSRLRRLPPVAAAVVAALATWYALRPVPEGATGPSGHPDALERTPAALAPESSGGSTASGGARRAAELPTSGLEGGPGGSGGAAAASPEYVRNLLRLVKFAIDRKDEKVVRGYQVKVQQLGPAALPHVQEELQHATDPVHRRVLEEIAAALTK